ncbi:MAG: uracil-DNA glycosylase family protein [Terriglobia bacterium]
MITGPRGSTEEDLLQTACAGHRRPGGLARAPGLETESLRLQIKDCRDCAAIRSIVLPPREFLVNYLKSDYPDLDEIRVVVIGRDSSLNASTYFYRSPEGKDRFISGVLSLVGAKTIAEFKRNCVLTDALRCHALVAPAPDRALDNCARHLRAELRLFSSARTIVLLGEEAYLQFYRFVLGRKSPDRQSWGLLLGKQGWAVEDLSLPEPDGRALRVISCHHPASYLRSPSIAHLLDTPA